MSRGSSTRNHGYNVSRRNARATAQSVIRDNPNVPASGLIPELIRLDVIDQHALTAFAGWGSTYGFPWHAVPAWKARDSKAIDVALWYDTTLCGLCYATPRKSKLCIKLILLERDPSADNPLRGKVGAFMLIPLLRYAESLKCSEIEVENPLPGALAIYSLLGFEFRVGQQGRRLVRSITKE
ncbi:hypothetical protein BJP27_24170 (plasmid) [Pseudomonas oryzihabitans]|nr:hypothetical protein BJP27_24170 [Pseudomonas psychrotolerans]